jgi:hypothetical protein
MLTLLDILLKVQANPNRAEDICNNVSDLLMNSAQHDAFSRLQDEVALHWDNYSGDCVYPVDSPAKYKQDHADATLWDSPLRHEYLALLIEEAQNGLYDADEPRGRGDASRDLCGLDEDKEPERQ